MVHLDHLLPRNVPAFFKFMQPLSCGILFHVHANDMFCIIITSKEHNRQNKVKGRKNERRENSVRLTR